MSELFSEVQTNEIVQIVEFIKNSDELSSAQQNPSQFFAKFGIILPTNYQYELYLNDDATLYMIVPTQSSQELTHEALGQFYAGGSQKPTDGTASTLGTVGTASSAGTVPSTWGTGSCFFCAGSLGSVSTKRDNN